MCTGVICYVQKKGYINGKNGQWTKCHLNSTIVKNCLKHEISVLFPKKQHRKFSVISERRAFYKWIIFSRRRLWNSHDCKQIRPQKSRNLLFSWMILNSPQFWQLFKMLRLLDHHFKRRQRGKQERNRIDQKRNQILDAAAEAAEAIQAVLREKKKFISVGCRLFPSKEAYVRSKSDLEKKN